jgi:hypothetical protein
MRRIAAITVATLCAVIVSCSGDGDRVDGDEASRHARATAGATMDSDAGLNATLQGSRLFETERALRLTVGHDGDDDLQIGAIQLGSPLFEPVQPQPRDARVRAGGHGVVMPLPYGAARCDAVADEPPQLITDVAGEQVRVAMDESPSGLLSSLHAAECAVAAVEADVELRLGDSWERTAPRTVEGEVELGQRRPGVEVTVEEVQGNVIFNLRTEDEPDANFAVNDRRPSAGVRVAITAARCDPHALIEYKRTFKFLAVVRLGHEEPVRVDIEAEGEAHRELEELLEACLD